MLAAGLLVVLTLPAAGQPKDPLAAMKFRNVGPSAGGRVCRVSGVPGDPTTYYAATAGGGIWKSSDGGLSWKAIFDEMPDASVGAVAVAPSDRNVVYAGGGEANIRGNVAAGHGLYRSTDGGKTWQHVWKSVGQVGTIAVHPTNADVAFAAVLGSPFGPNKERGVYRTTDGGKNWLPVLTKDEDTGASDVALDPINPRVVFAGLWQARRKPWEMTSGGPGSGLYVSRDGGDTWKQYKPGEDGLPKGPWGKVGVAVAPSQPQRVYALIEANEGGLFRSDDGGDSWRRVSDSRSLRQRAWYYSTITVDPSNADVVWCPQVPMLKSIDGGVTFTSVRGIHHGDHHDLWIDPKNPKRMIGANDGGVDISTDGGLTWHAPPLPISQFYHVTVDNAEPYHVLGNMQDLGTARGPSLGLTGGRVRLADWISVGGGETGFAVADPADPDVVYAGEYGGIITRFDRKTGQARNVSIWPYNPSGVTPAEMKYRFQWTAPIVVSKHDRAVYHAANVIFRSTDGGQSWQKISEDLTRNDKQKQQWSGGPITGDNTGVEIFGTVFALAESPKEKGMLWAGSDDGLVHVSRDGGGKWENVTANIPGMPDWATVRCIEPSPFDAATAYLVAEAHRLNDFRPYLWKTTDYGKTWTNLAEKLPADVYLHVVRTDPAKQGLLFAGTERGILYSTNDGKAWHKLRCGFPTAAVHDLQVKDNDLVAGTMGRSIWILDDFSPLRELTPAVKQKPLHLFAPPAATRWQLAGGFGFQRTGAGDNPPAGMAVTYHLAKKATKPLKLEVLDGQGRVVYTGKGPTPKAEEGGARSADDEEDDDDDPDAINLPSEPGLHRAHWNLRAKGAEDIPGARIDSGSPKVGPVVPPGTYTLRLTANGQKQEVKAELKPDPRSKADVAEQYALALKVRDDISRLAQAVKQLRAVRKQLLYRNELLGTDKKWENLRKQSKDLAARLDDLEGKLHNPKAKITYDILAQKGGAKLYSQMVFAYANLLEGDGPPTQGVRDVYAAHAEQLQKLLGEFDAVKAGELAKLNDEAKRLDAPTVFVPPAKKPAGMGE